MGNEVQKAYDELRNALWMLALPLIFGILSLIISFQWLIQDQLWEERLQETNPVIEEVEVSGAINRGPMVMDTYALNPLIGGLQLILPTARADNATCLLG